MSNDIASLGLRVDSSQVATANRELDKLSSSAARAEASTAGLGKTSETAAQSVERNADALGDIRAQLDGMSARVAALRGTFSGAAGAATSVVAIVGGVVAAAAAVALLSKAYIEGAREGELLQKSIFQTGNASGVTAGQLALMARNLDNVAGTQHAATEALATFVATGKIGAQDLERFTALAQRIERDVGTPIAETAKQFASLADKPSQAAAELQKSFNFLTPAIYNYIRAQEEAGNVSAAATAAQNAYAGAVERQLRQVDDSIPPIIKGWRAVKDAAKEAWDAMLNAGRDRTPEEQLANVQKQLKEANGFGRFGNELFVSGTSEAALREQEAQLQGIVDQRKKEADALKDLKDRTDAYIGSQTAATQGAEEFKKAQAEINAAWRSFDISTIQQKLRNVTASFEGAQAELDAQRSANLIDDEKYYARKRQLLEQQTAAEIKALRAESAVLEQQNDLSAVERIAAQAKIAANTARIVDLRTRSASQLHVLDTQQSADLRKQAAAYAEAQASADRYVATLTKRFQIESQGLGLGEEARQRLRDRADLESRFQDRRDDLERDRRRGQITEEQYRKYLKIEEDALRRSEDAYDEHYEVLKEKQGDWLVGAQEALANFRDSAQNVAGQVEEVFTRGLDGITDSLATWATTGKNTFKQLVNSILQDLLRIELKIIASKILQSIFSQGASTGSNPFSQRYTQGVQIEFPKGRANGGPVKAGQTYLVNEDTPNSEYFTPMVDGFITPARGMGGGVTNYNTFHFGPNSSVATTQAMVERGMAELEARIYQNMDRGRWRRVTG